MKQQISPAVAGVVIAIILIVAVVFLYRSTAGPPGPAPGQVGNASPFAPGGAALGQQGAVKPGAAGSAGGNPMAPRGGAPGSGGN
jgi:hypothetical protein